MQLNNSLLGLKAHEGQVLSVLWDRSPRRAGCDDRAGLSCRQSSAFTGDPELAGHASAARLGFEAEQLQQGMYIRSAREERTWHHQSFGSGEHKGCPVRLVVIAT